MAIKKLAKQEAQRYTNLSLEYKTDTGIVYALINTIKELKEQIK